MYKWGKRFNNGDGTSRDVPMAEIEAGEHVVEQESSSEEGGGEKEEEAEEDEEENDGAEDQDVVMGDQVDDEPQPFPNLPPDTRIIGGYYSSRDPTVPTGNNWALDDSFPESPAQPATLALEQSPLKDNWLSEYNGEDEGWVDSNDFLNTRPRRSDSTSAFDQYITSPAPLARPFPPRIGPIDQAILNCEYGKHMRDLAHRVFNPPAEDSRPWEEQAREQDEYLAWCQAIMGVEAGKAGFELEEWPHPEQGEG